MRRRLIAIVAICLFALGTHQAVAQTASVALRQFQHTAWNMQNGAPSQINALAQTTDGYLWIGTANGLFRFDGVTFEAAQLPAGQRFRQTSIQSLTATADGGLWIGYTFGKLDFLKDGRLQDQRFTGTVGATTYAIVAGTDGRTLAATLDGMLHLVNGVWQDAEEIKGLDIKSCYALVQDSKGTFWLTTDDLIYRLPRNAVRFESTGIHTNSGTMIHEAPDGTIWLSDAVGISRYQDWQGGRNKRTPSIKVSESQADFSFDAYGDLWILDEKTGISRVQNPQAVLGLADTSQRAAMEHFGMREGLSSNAAMISLLDREGNLWIGTPDGLDRFRRSVFDPAPLPATFLSYAVTARPDGSILIGTQNAGLQKLAAGRVTRVKEVTPNRIVSMYQASDGKLWLGGQGNMGYLQNDHFTPVLLPTNIRSPARDTQAITSGPDGDVWLQVASAGNTLLKLRSGQWSPVATAPKGFPTALTLTTDHIGHVWAGYLDGTARVFDGKNITVLTAAQGITTGNVTALYDSGTNMWIGGEHGMDVMISDRSVPVRFAGSTSIEGISGIILGNDGALWINSLPGVLRVSAEDVAHFLKDRSYAMPFKLFDYLDGLSGKAPQLRPLPSIIQGTGNTLWFTTTNGVASIDTANIYRNRLPPPVSISSIAVDGLSQGTQSTVTLQQGAQTLQISYAALSLSMPERVLFRYRLDGYDKRWQEAGTRRQAFYSHLPPGRYLFHVIACNNDGVWNEVGATLPITLPPTFVQSWYFKVLATGLALLAFRLLILVRTRQETSRMQTRLAERFNERQRIARNLHDTFIQGVQGLLLHVHNTARKLSADDPNRHALELTLQQSDAVMLQGRELLLNLRLALPDRDELSSRLRAAAMEFAHLNPSEFELTITGDAVPVTPLVFDELSKLGREALWNAYQHASAKRIEVHLIYRKDGLRLTVQDNGIGIEAQTLLDGRLPNHWGLPGMKERAAAIGASFEIRSTLDKGTTVSASVPARQAYRDDAGRKRSLLNRLFGGAKSIE